ncbi:hypothetical protein FSP39_013408 [Pinctada imbricata]|uniref:NWD1/2-like winged helix-turn-helix domain-containing protein n=1 Tax=Pinctada imbricata TaxID=66713 RepID=A0AA88XS56_PINIB|nr:hypothetical protein FSP39_013408 [Pinctada imbricata]
MFTCQILPRQTGCEIIDSYLVKKKRKVTDIQQRLILNTFDKAPSPLFLKLILDQACAWNSYSQEHELVLQDSVRGAINMLFDNLEAKFGSIVTSHTLGYFTIALNGISENELEDVLSCDDEALNDLYRYHDPPVEGIVRCPPVIVARIQYDIKEYIVERMSHGKYTKNWYHRQFVETAKARYCTGLEGEKLHRNMCEIYMGENGVKRSITLTRRKLTVPDADRQVTPQPVEVENKRMLRCLPYHIVHAGQQLPMTLSKDKCFCNLKFLSSFLQLCDVETLLDFFREFLERNNDAEVTKLHSFLSSCKSDLSKPLEMAISLMANIVPEEDNVYLKVSAQSSGKVPAVTEETFTDSCLPMHGP